MKHKMRVWVGPSIVGECGERVKTLPECSDVIVGTEHIIFSIDFIEMTVEAWCSTLNALKRVLPWLTMKDLNLVNNLMRYSRD